MSNNQELEKFNFYKKSKGYMQGYSKLHFYRRLPIAYIKFKWYLRKDK